MKTALTKNLFITVATLSLSLSAFADGHKYCVGEAVVYTQNGIHYNAKIDELYQDGSVSIEFPNHEFAQSQVQLSTLSIPLDSESGFQLGQAVVYTQNGSHYNAKIDALYEDGTVLVEFPNGEFTQSTVNLSTLSVAQDTESGFSVGESVVYVQNGVHYNAQIDELYADGSALVHFPNGEFTPSQIQLSTLSVAQEIESGFSVGQSVVYEQNGVHYNAQIDELYADGSALVHFPNGEFTPSQIQISNLSIALDSESGFYVGESVVYTQNGTHYNAKIDELYQDGAALVEFPGGEFTQSQISLSTLSIAMQCSPSCHN